MFYKALLATLVLTASAVPTRRQAVTTLSGAEVASYKPYTYYASTGYCDPSTTLTWTCGANCQANSGFEPVASGGDGAVVQYWYVGYDPMLKTVIVAHQGTDESKIIPVLEDADFILGPLDPKVFPGISLAIEVHQGFAFTQADSAPGVLAAVKTALSRYNASTVTVTGHSLGAAIALLDFVYLPLHLPSSTTVRMIGYGLPRVGNQAFADYVDAHGGVTHINNREDLVPILPPRFVGYHHPSGEVHIQDSGAWDACPGQDNESKLCTTGDVPTIFEGNATDHDGPYDGVEMGC